MNCPVCLEGATAPSCRIVLYPGCEKEVRGCPSCGAAVVLPLPTAEEISRCYAPVYYRDFFRQYWKDYYKGKATALRLSAWKPEGDFLDVGCALGTLLAGLRDHSRWRASGLEYSEGAVGLGRALNGLDLRCASLAMAPWPDASFDYVHINNVLEHEAAPEAGLKAAARLLRRGGRLELIVPNGPVDLLPNKDLYTRLGRPFSTRHGGHLYFFSKASLRKLLERSGFKVLSIRWFHFKQGLKARGWLPGAYKPFLKESSSNGGPAAQPLTIEEGRNLIPSRPSWALYYSLYRWRRLWRWPVGEFGYDFEVLAERS